jgi:hypothetical protein
MSETSTPDTRSRTTLNNRLNVAVLQVEPYPECTP